MQLLFMLLLGGNLLLGHGPESRPVVITMQNLGLQFLVCILSFIFPYNCCRCSCKKQIIDISQPGRWYCSSGESVSVEDEVVVINSIVLPNKTLNVSVQEEIIL